MSVEQRKVVDAIGIRGSDGRVVLTISDHLPWLPDNEHLLLPQTRATVVTVVQWYAWRPPTVTDHDEDH
jgi:hypothetical protein